MSAPDQVAADEAVHHLDAVTVHLPGGESRAGQRAKAAAVARSVDEGRHLVVQAGTGTGKTLAYLVPLLATSGPVVVATATKALQDQLATKDLPFLREHLPHPFTWAVLKGRANYLCRQRVGELAEPEQGRLALDELAAGDQLAVRRLAAWADQTETGDRAELAWEPGDRAWSAVSVTSDQCPGAAKCPAGEACFAEAARRRAAEADVVVVNTHLYGLHVASQGSVLPQHDVVVFDEAHQLEDVISDTAGVSIGPGRCVALARQARRLLADGDLPERIVTAGELLGGALADHAGDLVADPPPPSVEAALATLRLVVGELLAAARGITTGATAAEQQRLRLLGSAGRLADDLDAVLARPPDYVAWVPGTGAPSIELAPLAVGPLLAARVWAERRAVLTSATIPSSLVERVGLPRDETDVLDVGSPFDYEDQALLYCAVHLADPRQPAHAEQVLDELHALITAAEGRTLALFTSRAAMHRAAEALRARLDTPVLTQDDLPKPALVEVFRADPATSLFATAGLFQGIDVPGETLSLVTIDRIPFPRPDEPLLRARREQLGAGAFQEIDLPRAATLLAQAAGRLIRSTTDRGVVAVLDPRLGTARYRWDLVRALPPMRRTRHRSEAEALLRSLVRASAAAPPGRPQLGAISSR